MKVRELRLRHFRNVGQQLRTISFADEATGLVRPLTVLVGSNGSGKSTVFEVIEGLLSSVLDIVEDRPVVRELNDTSYAAMRLDFSDHTPESLQPESWIVLGRRYRPREEHDLFSLSLRGKSPFPGILPDLKLDLKGPSSMNSAQRSVFSRWVEQMVRAMAQDGPAELAAWGESRAAPRPLDAVFAEHKTRIDRGGMPQWQVEITGKAVLKVFLRQLQLATSQIPFEILCSLYLERHPDPPPEVAAIVDTLLSAAGT